MTMLSALLNPLPGPTAAEVAEFLDQASLKRLAGQAGLLGPLFTASPYLFDLVNRHQDWLAEILDDTPDLILAAILDDVAATGSAPLDTLKPQLRQLKGRIALFLAIAETGGALSTAQSTAAMSDFADASLAATLDALMRQAGEKGTINLSGEVRPSEECGLAIFALGKQGGRELNYSSDIDIVAFYDPPSGLLAESDEANRFYTRIVQKLVAIMEERVAGAIVFRTDLRLRPDPASTPLALGVPAALQYYESRGQNWERAAWIKARVAAGDKSVGNAFLDDMAPFVWRKHLDFATIEDIQAIKRQINLTRGITRAAVLGHNVKLGHGGIREIEFFAQTQQLIAGGRDLSLRVRPTTRALAALASANWIDAAAARELDETYWFLRAVENRLQMRRDEQVHALPDTAEGLGIVATMMGFADGDDFAEAYRTATATVLKHYSDLFSQSESLASETGDLVFTGGEDDPGTLETLAKMGFAEPARASSIIRRWHYGSYAATRAAAARAHLTGLLPALLRMFAEAGNADEALARFDNFLARLPAGIQLFALLRAHHTLCRLLILFMASAPRLADEVIHRAHVMDGLIDPTFADELNRPGAMHEKVDAFLSEAATYEDLIDRARLIGQEQKFLISAGFVSGTIGAARAGRQFANLAQSLLGRLYEAARTEFEVRHGKIPGARTALLAFGKFASREMTATSDLDFILLYEAPPEVEASDGDKPLTPAHYYARLTQRLLAALAAPTAAGVLYEADMRLRPSGNKGPLATPLGGFQTYQANTAWTWEHLALSRARVVYADDALDDQVHAMIDEILATPRDTTKRIADVVDMRTRMARDRKPRHAFDLKLADGGLIDLEFIAQSAQIIAHKTIGLPRASTREILLRLGELGWLPEAERLAEIHHAYETIIQAMSTCLLNPFRQADWTKAFEEFLALLTNCPSFEFLVGDVTRMREEVQAAAAAWYVRALEVTPSAAR